MFGLKFSPATDKSSPQKPVVLEVVLADGSTQTVTWKPSARSRSLRLRVSSHGVQVSSPLGTPQRLVEGFINHQKEWIRIHTAKTKSAQSSQLWYRGKPYTIEIKPDGHQSQRVQITGETCQIVPVTHTQDSAKNVLERWLVSQAGEVGTPMLQDLAKKIGVEVPQLRFRETTSRWGSCTQHGAIMLNWRLIHAPDQVYRYVIIHELAHRVHMNHSAAFWRLVQEFDPSYPVHQGWLKRNAHHCRTPQLPAL